MKPVFYLCVNFVLMLSNQETTTGHIWIFQASVKIDHFLREWGVVEINKNKNKIKTIIK